MRTFSCATCSDIMLKFHTLRTQQSIRKVVTFALKFYSRCGEDLWDCLVEECQKGSINTRINVLYLLDTLCETSLLTKAHSSEGGMSNGGSYYVDLVARDLSRIVDYVVPDNKEGLLNLLSATQVRFPLLRLLL